MNGGALSVKKLMKEQEDNIRQKIFIERNKIKNEVDIPYNLLELKKMLEKKINRLDNQFIKKKSFEQSTLYDYFAIRLRILETQNNKNINDIEEVFKNAPKIYLKYLEYIIYYYSSNKNISLNQYLKDKYNEIAYYDNKSKKVVIEEIKQQTTPKKVISIKAEIKTPLYLRERITGHQGRTTKTGKEYKPTPHNKRPLTNLEKLYIHNYLLSIGAGF